MGRQRGVHAGKDESGAGILWLTVFILIESIRPRQLPAGSLSPVWRSERWSLAKVP
jgi:hypothetical protein